MKSKSENLFETVTLRPYKQLCISVYVRLYYLLAVLLLQVAMLFITKSWQSLCIVASTVVAVELAETAELFTKKRHICNWLQALRVGIIIGLLLPERYPPLMAFWITLIVVLICKRLLGGDVNTWVNPAALAVVVCWLSSTQVFPQFSLTEELLQTKNASLSFIQNGAVPVLAYDSPCTAFFNKTVYRFFDVTVPDGYISLWWDSGAVIPAFRFNVLTLLSSIVLIAANVIDALIPAVHLIVYLLLVRFVSPLFYGGSFGQGDMLLALCTSGTLFCTLFLLQWVGTPPLTRCGKFLYGVIAGVFSFLIVGCGDSPSGFIFTVLVMNVVSPLLQGIETIATDRYVQNVLIPRSEALQKDGAHA